jgi:FtsH-binding integral membrane protein
MRTSATVLATLGLVAALVALAALADPAWAQSGVPQPQLRRGPAPWVGFVVMFALLVLVMAVSLMPSKRGHQD